MKNQVLFIAVAICLYSCSSKTKTNEMKNFKLISSTDEAAIVLETVKPEEIELELTDNIDSTYVEDIPVKQLPKNLDSPNRKELDRQKSKKTLQKKRPEEHKNEELPQTYRNRTFIKNLTSLTYKLEEIPGYIVRYDRKIKDYRIVSLVRFVKNNLYPEIKLIEDGIIYSSKINSGANFNATALIGGLTIDKQSIMELIIQDVMMSIVPDTLILKDEIRRVAENIPVSERKDYFFIKGTTLTLVNNKKYNEQKFEAKVNSTYVTASGKVYASNDRFSRERLVSLDLISLDDIIALNNQNLIQ